MTKEQTKNWEIVNNDTNRLYVRTEKYPDGELIMGKEVDDFISKTITQEREKWNIALEQKFAGASLSVCEMIDEFIKESDNLLQK